MSHRRDLKRAAAGGYPGPPAARRNGMGVPAASVAPHPQHFVDGHLIADRVRHLLRTWEQFGLDSTDAAITELRAAIDLGEQR